MADKLYQELAKLVQQRLNCIESKNQEWLDRSTARLLDLVRNHMPSGSGIDNGTKINLDMSTDERLVFTFGYHHMNDGGYYDGWTEHKAIVRGSLTTEIRIRITGPNRNQVRDYLHETFDLCLRADMKAMSGQRSS